MTGELILIIDDNALNRTLLRDVLEFHSYRIIEASAAEPGIELARANLPDLILMDIAMPGMDGLAALAVLRADARTAHLNVLAVTAYATRQEEDRIMASGFDGYLSKPLDMKLFPSQIRQFCDEGHFRTASAP